MNSGVSAMMTRSALGIVTSPLFSSHWWTSSAIFVVSATTCPVTGWRPVIRATTSAGDAFSSIRAAWRRSSSRVASSVSIAQPSSSSSDVVMRSFVASQPE
jgi:hypothetical protein